MGSTTDKITGRIKEAVGVITDNDRLKSEGQMDQVVAEVRDHFGEKVCRTVIPRTVRLSEAPSYGQPIITLDASSRGAIAYSELAKEVSNGSA